MEEVGVAEGFEGTSHLTSVYSILYGSQTRTRGIGLPKKWGFDFFLRTGESSLGSSRSY